MSENTSRIKRFNKSLNPARQQTLTKIPLLRSLALGVGTPQSESLSVVGSVLTLIIIGLPSAALILSVALIVIRRRQTHPGQGYRAI